MRLPPLVCFAAAALSWLAAAAQLSAAPAWRILQTPRYEIVSQLSEKQTRAWATEFGQFIGALQTEISPNERLLPPLTVVLFARERDFEPYRPRRPDGVQQEVAGVFVSRDTWAAIGMARGFDDEQTRRTIFHEGVHWYMHSLPIKTPHWLSEGIAEVFSTFTIEGKKMTWGLGIPWHVLLLRNERALPMEKLLSVRAGDKMFNEEDATGLFYAQSWAFVHYLIFGQREGERSALRTYLEAWNRAEAQAGQVLQQSLGKNYRQLDEILDQYMQEGKYYRREIPVQAPEGAPLVVAPASPRAVEEALAKLALGTGQFARAKQHAEALVSLDPDQPTGYDLLAWLAAVMEDKEAVAERTQQAMSRSSKDAWTMVLSASLQLQETEQPDAVQARKIANLCERAINRRPNLEAAYTPLLHALAFVGKPSAEDEKFIQQGRRFFPEEGRFAVFLAQAARQRGEMPAASRYLEEALQRAESFSIEGIAQVRQMADEWAMEDQIKVVERMVQAGKAAEAAEALDRWMEEHTLAFGQRQRMLALSRQLQFTVEIEKVYALAKEGALDTAVAKLNALQLEYSALEWRGQLKNARDYVELLQRKHLRGPSQDQPVLPRRPRKTIVPVPGSPPPAPPPTP